VLTNARRPESLDRQTHLHFINLESLNYQKEFNIFLEKYVHLSTNSKEFELACFERYFALNALFNSLNLSAAWQLDTDVWPSKFLHVFDEFELVLSCEYLDRSVISAHASKFSSRCLKDLVSFLNFRLYDDHLEEMTRVFNDRIKGGLLGGICDMRAIGYWLKSSTGIKWHNSYGSETSGYFINDTLGTLELEVTKAKKINKFFLVKRTQTGFSFQQLGSKKLFATLHFQGHYKLLIPIFDRTSLLMGNLRTMRLTIRILAKIKSLLQR